MGKVETHPNKIILWEFQKKRVCQHYECSDSHDRQYPNCKGVLDCPLCNLFGLLFYLNEVPS